MRILSMLLLVFTALFASASSQLVFHEDFSKTSLNTVPEGFLVLDGGFSVKEQDGNRYLELPGAPLESFAAQFGPVSEPDAGVSARIRGSSSGRRFPVFGVGLNGIAGCQLRLAPAKGALELCRDQKVKSAAPFAWKSNAWVHFKLQVVKGKAGAWKAQGKAWLDQEAEPERWMIDWEDQETPTAGRASIFGSPYAGTPIQFDDLEVFKVLP